MLDYKTLNRNPRALYPINPKYSTHASYPPADSDLVESELQNLEALVPVA